MNENQRAIEFTKLSATGNDFILLDYRSASWAGLDERMFQALCHRQTGVGADGVLLIEASAGHDFSLHYLNADGRESEMCGNGARAAAFYAAHHGLAPAKMRFEIRGVSYSAEVAGQQVALTMHPPTELVMRPGVLRHDSLSEGGFAVVGVPHYVLFVDATDVEQLDVSGLGRYYRHAAAFAPRGTNVNFVALLPSGELKIRTYERGVEAETLACGTGAVASAFVAREQWQMPFPIGLQARGGRLCVDFDSRLRRPVLSGEVRSPFRGTVDLQMLEQSHGPTS